MNEEMSPKDHQEPPPQQPGNQGSNSNATVPITEEDLLEAENDLQGIRVCMEWREYRIFWLQSRPFLAEIEALNDNLDDLNSVLDTIEQRADDMKAKLLELLMSNREIMKSLREGGGDDDEGDIADKCNHHPGKPADEA